MCEVEYYASGGGRRAIEKTLKRACGYYASRYSVVKVGITTDPEKRLKQHQRKRKKFKWDRMVVIYYTSSIENAVHVEKVLINHFLERSRTHAWLANDVGGGGGRRPEESARWYVYILLARPKK